jgi:LAO/AO transport system kinase
MATRGYMGGLSRTTRETAFVFDAMGYDVILIETVGVGQDEVEVADLAHTTTVVSLPGMGDEIQAMKAGLLEIGDIFVVNKADKSGADDVVDQLRLMLDMRSDGDGAWNPPILKTVAINAEGISELVDAFWAHREHLLQSGKFAKHNSEREFQFFRRLVIEMTTEKIFRNLEELPAFTTLLEDLKNREIDPYSAAEMILGKVECTF